MARVVVIGAGAGGLAAALSLASAGCAVTVLERAAAPGGKMRTHPSPLGPIDIGPTVFTMRFVFEQMFARAGLCLDDFVRLSPLTVLARHAWSNSAPFDLFADPKRAIDAVGDFAGWREAQGFARFLADGARVYRTLLAPFMTAQRPSPMELASRVGLRGLPDMLATKPFETLWRSLGDYFHDPRLRQLFARYATYTGANPFQAPATLMLIAHVEQTGVSAVEGGMQALAAGVAEAAATCGARFRYHTGVRSITARDGAVTGVITQDGEFFPADAVVANCDVAALHAGAFGPEASHAVGGPSRLPRSLSALTFAGTARTAGFALSHHTVFFGDAYEAEFRAIMRQGRLPADPTVYVCAQDRSGGDANAALPAERLFLLVNAPARADRSPLSAEEITACQSAAFHRMMRAGLQVQPIETPDAPWGQTTPQDFHRLFPHTGGAIYGPANHGPFAAFRRQGARTKLPGLYLAGGSVHPSAGVPMATLSGVLAAQALLADQPFTRPFFRAGISGGTSTRSPTTVDTV